MPSVSDNNEDAKAKNVWYHISQFVCYEYCRHFQRYLHGPSGRENDLLSFFKEMVVEMTTKVHEAEVTKHEVLAKFLDELKGARTVEEFKIVFQIAQKVKSICPEFVPCLNELLSSLKMKLRPLMLPSGSGRFDAGCIADDISKFSTVASRLLPQPDLVKIFDDWMNRSLPPDLLTEERILDKLKSALSPEDVPEILKILDADTVFKNYMKHLGVPVMPDGETPASELETEDLAGSEREPVQDSRRVIVSGEPLSSSRARHADLLSVTTADINESPDCMSADSVSRIQLDRLGLVSNTETSSCDFINPVHFKKPQRPSTVLRTRLQQSQSRNVGGSSSGDFTENVTVDHHHHEPSAVQHPVASRAGCSQWPRRSAPALPPKPSRRGPVNVGAVRELPVRSCRITSRAAPSQLPTKILPPPRNLPRVQLTSSQEGRKVASIATRSKRKSGAAAASSSEERSLTGKRDTYGIKECRVVLVDIARQTEEPSDTVVSDEDDDPSYCPRFYTKTNCDPSHPAQRAHKQYVYRPRPLQATRRVPFPRKSQEEHIPSYITRLGERLSAKEKRCVFCLKEKRVQKVTRFCCIICKVPLCPAPCFKQYHEERYMWQ